jgi:hypothetical protein
MSFRGCTGCGITRYLLVFDSFKGYESSSSLSCDLTPCRRPVGFYRAVCAGVISQLSVTMSVAKVRIDSI